MPVRKLDPRARVALTMSVGETLGEELQLLFDAATPRVRTKEATVQRDDLANLLTLVYPHGASIDHEPVQKVDGFGQPGWRWTFTAYGGPARSSLYNNKTYVETWGPAPIGL